MMNFVSEIDTDGKYKFWAFIWYQNCVAGVVSFVLKFCQETSKKQP